MPNFIDVNSGERPFAQALNGHNQAAISNIDRLFQGKRRVSGVLVITQRIDQSISYRLIN